MPEPVATCPVCRRVLDAAMRAAMRAARAAPFCSRRCADVDLGRWLGEGYRFPGGEEECAFEDPRPG